MMFTYERRLFYKNIKNEFINNVKLKTIVTYGSRLFKIRPFS